MSSLFTITSIGKPSTLVHAYLEDDTTIVVKLTDPLPFETSDVTVTDITIDRAIPVLNVALPQAFANDPDGDVQPLLETAGEPCPTVPTDLVVVMLAEAPDVTHNLHIALKGYMQGPVTPRRVLNGEQYLYQADDLGNTYQPQATSFRLWFLLPRMSRYSCMRARWVLYSDR